MNDVPDTLAQLAAITSEMAALQDLAGKRLADLLEARGALIHQLIAGSFDPNDNRLATIISDADRLQEKLQRRAGALRRDLSGVKATGALMAAFQSTLNQPETNVLDIRG
jgi:hypothetical protein